MTRPRPDHNEDDGSTDDVLKLSHLRVGMPVTASSDPAAVLDERLRHVNEALGPFVAWLATQGIEDVARRRHRDAVERYLDWCLDDGGSPYDRRRRYVQDVRRDDPEHLTRATEGLSWWSDHRRIVAQTLPVDG